MKKFFRPRHSLILLYDHLPSPQGVQAFEEQIDHVGGFYEPSRLPDLFTHRGSRRGKFVVAFKNARKSVFLSAIPFLKDRKIPCTVFLRSDCIGLNRLPVEDELAAYREHRVAEADREAIRLLEARSWIHAASARLKLQGCREAFGPLPLEKMEPTQFFVTWGKLLEVGPEWLDLGFALTEKPEHPDRLKRELDFLRRQTGRPIQTAFSPLAWGEAAQWDSFGIGQVVTLEPGVIDEETNPLRLPRWDFRESEKGFYEKEESEKESARGEAVAPEKI